MLTMRRLSMGAGFKYLMESIAVGDGAAQQSSTLTRYYTESGTPPGCSRSRPCWTSHGDGRGSRSGLTRLGSTCIGCSGCA